MKQTAEDYRPDGFECSHLVKQGNYFRNTLYSVFYRMCVRQTLGIIRSIKIIKKVYKISKNKV